MLKDKFKTIMKGYVVVQYKWVLLSKLAASCIILVAGLLLAGGATGPSRQLNNVAVASAAAPADGAAHFKPAILKWMRDNSEMPEQVLSAIYDAASKSNNADIIIAISLVESRFNPEAKSHKGAVGLMGIMPHVWLEELVELGLAKDKRDLYAIRTNVAAGAYIFERYLSKTNNIQKALFQYVGGDPDYADKVMQALGEIYLARANASARG